MTKELVPDGSLKIPFLQDQGDACQSLQWSTSTERIADISSPKHIQHACCGNNLHSTADVACLHIRVQHLHWCLGEHK